MGQYYKPIILGKNRKTIKGFFYSHHYGNGLKLMEHSYLRNNFVGAVVAYLKQVGGANLVWAGDYADPEPYTLTKKLTREQAMPIWQKKVAEGTTLLSFEKFYASKDRDLFVDTKDDAECLYSLAGSKENEKGKVIRRQKPEITVDVHEIDDTRYIINTNKKQYIDLWMVEGIDTPLHPLPLLTAEGNGRGGGDYEGTNMKLVGSWARDFIKVAGNDWDLVKSLKEQNYKEISPLFVENYTLGRSLNLIIEGYNNIKAERNFSGHDAVAIKDAIKALREILKEEEPTTVESEPATTTV